MKFLICLSLVALAAAGPTGYGNAGYGAATVARPISIQSGYGGASYGGSSGSSYGSAGASYGGSASLGVGSALGGSASNLNAHGLLNLRQGSQRQEVVQAAIQQLGRTVEYKVVPYQDKPIEAQVIEVEPSDIPLHLHFKTRSSSLSLSQSHQPGQVPEVQQASAQDEPARLLTEIQKPVIQEVREVVTPYRQVTQEINPVVEAVHTVVTKGEGQRAVYQGAGLSSQYNSGAAVQGASLNRGASYGGSSYGGASYGAASNANQLVVTPVSSNSGSSYGHSSSSYGASLHAPATSEY